MINADKPQQWKSDIAASVDLYNSWFLEFAPITFQETRGLAARLVADALVNADDLLNLTPDTLAAYPEMLPTMRLSTAPPIARDRLIGLARVAPHLVKRLENGSVPKRMSAEQLGEQLQRICDVIARLVDRDIFVWLSDNRSPDEVERLRAATIVADRLCGAQSDPIIRNAQEQRQLALIEAFLSRRGYVRKPHPAFQPITLMEAGTFTFRMNLPVGQVRKVIIPIDVVIQPHSPRPHGMPILIEAKSAGDFTNTNKRRKEEAQKIRQISEAYGPNAELILFLCGYFDSGYLGYEAAEGLDWVWEHRIEDLALLGL